MADAGKRNEGLRERKRRQTLQRIAEVGLELFLAKGYEATTLDEIATAAGISRRTFFLYFESKSDILIFHQRGYAEAIKASILRNSSGGAPIDVVCRGLVDFAPRFQSPEMFEIARLMRDSVALRARSPASYMQFERAVYEALCELWPARAGDDRLRLVAMVSIGALRLAADAWFQQDGRRSLKACIEDAFRSLKEEI